MRLRLAATQLRDELVARGTFLPPLADDADELRKQVNYWMALKRLALPTTVTHAPVLVIPVKDEPPR